MIGQLKQFIVHRRRCEDDVDRWRLKLLEDVTAAVDNTVNAVKSAFDDEQEKILDVINKESESTDLDSKLYDYSTISFGANPAWDLTLSSWLGQKTTPLGHLQVSQLGPDDFFLLVGENDQLSVLLSPPHKEIDREWQLMTVKVECSNNEGLDCLLNVTHSGLIVSICLGLPCQLAGCMDNHEVSVTLFGRHIRNSPIKIEGYKKSYEIPRSVDKVVEDETMTSEVECNTRSTLPKVERRFHVGDICLARWSEDGVWYRVRVETYEHELYLVTFTDYDNHDSVNDNNIVKDIDEIPHDQLDNVDQYVEGKFKDNDVTLSSENKPCKDEQEVESSYVVDGSKFAVGDICLAKWSEDNVWYRARIDKIDQEVFYVTFTDYGNSEKVVSPNMASNLDCVPKDDLDMLDQYVEEIKKLRTVTEESSTVKNESFIVGTSDVHSLVQQIIQTLDPEKIEVGKIESQIKELVEPQEIRQQDLALPQFLIGQVCLSRWPEDKVWYRSKVEAVEDGKYTVIFTDYGNTAIVSLPDIVTDLDNVPRDQMEMIDEFVSEERKELRRPLLDHINKKVIEPVMTIPVTNSESMVTMPVICSETILPLSAVINSPEDKTNFSVDELCLAKWSEDQVWYRAKVLAVDGEKKVYHVTFVDYDNNETVEVPNIVKSFEEIPLEQLHMMDSFVEQNNNNQNKGHKVVSGDLADDEEDVEIVIQESELNKEDLGFMVGETCLARWSEDLVWYRGRVEKVEDEGYVVAFIDYDNVETVKHPNIVGTFDKIPMDQLSMLDQFVEDLNADGVSENITVEIHKQRLIKVEFCSSINGAPQPKTIVTKATQVEEIEVLSRYEAEDAVVTEEEINVSIISCGSSELEEPTPDHDIELGSLSSKFNVGQTCVAQWSEDLVWYRARIERIEKEGYLVTFIDYDNEDVVSFHNTVATLAEVPTDQLDMVDEYVQDSQEVNMTRNPANVDTSPSSDMLGLYVKNADNSEEILNKNEVKYSILQAHYNKNHEGNGYQNPVMNDMNYSIDEEYALDNKDKLVQVKWTKGDQCCLLREGKHVSAVVDVVSDGIVQVTIVENGTTDFIPECDLLDINDVDEESKVEIKAGDCCIALWPNNHTWYNAKIIEMRPTSARVVFTDYLDLDIIPLSNIAHSMAEVSSEQMAVTHIDQYMIKKENMNQNEDKMLKSYVQSPVRGYSTEVKLCDPTAPSRLYGEIYLPIENLKLDLKLDKSLSLDCLVGSILSVALLPPDQIIVACSKSDCLAVCDYMGNTVTTISGCPDRLLVRPSEMLVLSSGDLVVRDVNGLHLLEDVSWRYVRTLGKDLLDLSSGLAEDQNGQLVIINHRPLVSSLPCKFTSPGETDIFLINITSGCVVKRIELVDILLNDREHSLCNHVACCGGVIYILDSGLKNIYIFNQDDNVELCSGNGRFREPSSLVVDDAGNMFVVDSKQSSIVIVDKELKVLSTQKINALGEVSGAVMDKRRREVVVYNSVTNSLMVFKLVKS